MAADLHDQFCRCSGQEFIGAKRSSGRMGRYPFTWGFGNSHKLLSHFMGKNNELVQAGKVTNSFNIGFKVRVELIFFSLKISFSNILASVLKGITTQASDFSSFLYRKSPRKSENRRDCKQARTNRFGRR